MSYTVSWRKLPGKQLISSEDFESKDDAFDSADVAMIVGPGSVEITISDDTGAVRLLRIVNNA